MELRAEGCRAVFDPQDGGRLTSFRIGDHEILVANGADRWHFGSFVMAPWVGRLRDARLDYNSRQYAFEANSGPHALHGLVTQAPWRVTSDGEMSIDLPSSWPWRGRVVQRLELLPGEARFRIELHAQEAMPAAVGWHPWFVRCLAGTALSSQLRPAINPRLMWANDASGMPNGSLSAPASQPWDYCFRDLEADPLLRWGGELELTVSSDCEDWVIYNMEEAGICVEPWTAPPNSLNMPSPRVVVPDEPLIAWMTWRWR